MEKPWSVRRARAVHLLGQAPHAEEILTFYVRLSEVQESVAEGVRVADLSGLVRSGEGDFPRLRLEKLLLGPLALPFHNFLSRVAEFGTETIKDGAQALLAQDDDPRLERLEDASAGYISDGDHNAARPARIGFAGGPPAEPSAWLEVFVASYAGADNSPEEVSR